MTPTVEAEFIALWQQGLETATIAERLGIPPGTARSRAYTLPQQGKIQPRPRGGRRTPARQKALEIVATPDDADGGVHSPVHTVHKVQAQLYALHGAVQKEVESSVDLQELLGEALPPLLARFTALEGEVKALRVQGSAPVQSSVYALHGAEHPDVAPEDLKSERWNIDMPRWLRRLVEAEAAAAHLSPSQVLQAVVKAWTEQRYQGAGEGS